MTMSATLQLTIGFYEDAGEGLGSWRRSHRSPGLEAKVAPARMHERT